MVFVYLALASFGFGSPVGHYLLGGPFIFGPVKSNLVKYQGRVPHMSNLLVYSEPLFWLILAPARPMAQFLRSPWPPQDKNPKCAQPMPYTSALALALGLGFRLGSKATGAMPLHPNLSFPPFSLRIQCPCVLEVTRTCLWFGLATRVLEVSDFSWSSFHRPAQRHWETTLALRPFPFAI